MDSLQELLVNILDDGFSGKGWQGPSNLVNTVENLTLDQLTFSSSHEGYSIWQIALHCVYWKWYVRKILVGQEAGNFQRSPADFPSLPTVINLETWQKDFDLLLAEHSSIIKAVKEFPRQEWWDIAPGEKVKRPFVNFVYGVAAHDIYHTGQIRNMGVPNL
jgi:uncharacterized damage-inducible protein DinB